jgi:hypothetical protein
VWASSSYAREMQARHRLKSFGRASVCNAGNWRAIADAYGCKGTVFTGGRFAV